MKNYHRRLVGKDATGGHFIESYLHDLANYFRGLGIDVKEWYQKPTQKND